MSKLQNARSKLSTVVIGTNRRAFVVRNLARKSYGTVTPFMLHFLKALPSHEPVRAHLARHASTGH